MRVQTSDEGEGHGAEVEDAADDLPNETDDPADEGAEAAEVAAAARGDAQELQRRRQRPGGSGQGLVARAQRGDHDHLAQVAQNGGDQILAGTALAEEEGPGDVRRRAAHYGAAAHELHQGVWRPDQR